MYHDSRSLASKNIRHLSTFKFCYMAQFLLSSHDCTKIKPSTPHHGMHSPHHPEPAHPHHSKHFITMAKTTPCSNCLFVTSDHNIPLLLLILLSSLLLFALVLDRPRPLRATSGSAVANTQLLWEEYLWAMRGDEKADAVLRQNEEEPEIDKEGEEGEDSQIDGQEEEDNDNNNDDDDDDDGYDEDMPWKHGNMELLQGPFEPRYNTFARTMRLEDDGKKAIWAVGPKSMEWLVPLDPE